MSARLVATQSDAEPNAKRFANVRTARRPLVDAKMVVVGSSNKSSLAGSSAGQAERLGGRRWHPLASERRARLLAAPSQAKGGNLRARRHLSGNVCSLIVDRLPLATHLSAASRWRLLCSFFCLAFSSVSASASASASSCSASPCRHLTGLEFKYQPFLFRCWFESTAGFLQPAVQPGTVPLENGAGKWNSFCVWHNLSGRRKRFGTGPESTCRSGLKAKDCCFPPLDSSSDHNRFLNLSQCESSKHCPNCCSSAGEYIEYVEYEIRPRGADSSIV